MIIKSFWNVDIDCEIIDNNSDNLAVILPGIGYNLSRAYMKYSIKLALEQGFDVLPIQFGFQIAGKKFDKELFESLIDNEDESLFESMVDESRKLLYGCIKKRYKHIVFIGKSVGTAVQSLICKDLNCFVKHIYLTPIDKTVEIGIIDNSLVVSGTNDPFLSKANLSVIKNNKTLQFIEVDDADHSLDIKGDVIKSIDILYNIMKKIKVILSDI